MGFRQQAGNGNSGGSTTIQQLMGSAVLQGSKLVAYIVGGTSATNIVSGVSDTINGSTGWVRVVGSSAAESGGPTSGEVWVNPNSAAGPAPTITATYTVSQTFRAIIIHEVTGCDPTEGAAAPASARSQLSVTNFTTANVTPAQNGSYIFGACSNDIDATVPTANSPFTLEGTTATQVTATEDQIQAVAAAIGASFTFSPAKSGVVSVVAFAPASSTVTGGIAPPSAFHPGVGPGRMFGRHSPQAFVPGPPPIPSFNLYGRSMGPGRHVGALSMLGTQRAAAAFAVPSTFQTFVYAGSGGLQSGGAAPVQVLFVPPPSGGLQSGGHAPLQFVAIPKPSGGLQSGGTSPSSFTKVYLPTGGLFSGGHGPVQFIAVFRPTGGLQSGGHAPIAILAVVQPTGGLHSGGAAPRLFIAFPKPSGGLNSGGAAFTAFVPAGGVTGLLQMIEALQRLGDTT